MTRQITNMAEEQTSEPLRWWLRIDCVAITKESMNWRCSLYKLFESVIFNGFN